MSSTERFGYEWNKYSAIKEIYEDQFKNWVNPLEPTDFFGKKILDAGCGMGRNSYWAIKWGAKEVVAFDFDQRSVEAAKKNLAEFNNTKVFFKSIYDLDWQNEFDLAFSIGVIHHLKDPRLAIKNLIRSLKPGGKLVIWVYGYEGNEWIVKFINPIRINFTSKIPVKLANIVSYFFSLPLWIFLKFYFGQNSYLKQLAAYKFQQVHLIVLDQLIPDTANYWKREEVDKMIAEIGGLDYSIAAPPNKSGWIIQGIKI